MTRPARFIPIFIAALCSIAGCASSKQWSVSGAEKAEGLVRVSYEFPEAHEPSLSENSARQLALQRCEGWGYDDAEPIAGQLRQCSNMDDGSCNLWTVTREFQCTRGEARSVDNQGDDGNDHSGRGVAQANIAVR
ncbi:MAG TPA: YecR family lipoprotein [Steroidobacteraceae bacterium]|nr:YecR family lipoprotein [Steroidobacteraceae bacterium]